MRGRREITERSKRRKAWKNEVQRLRQGRRKKKYKGREVGRGKKGKRIEELKNEEEG